MSEVAIICKVYPISRSGQPKKFLLEPVVEREGSTALRCCHFHPRIVYFDEQNCPVCQIERERTSARKEPRL